MKNTHYVKICRASFYIFTAALLTTMYLNHCCTKVIMRLSLDALRWDVLLHLHAAIGLMYNQKSHATYVELKLQDRNIK
jgi:hypothetical protein